MFVVFTSQQDDCAARVYAELRSRGHDVMIVDDARSTSEIGLSWYMDKAEPYRGWIGVDGSRAPLDAIDGILLRMLNPFRPEADQNPHDRGYVLAELAAAVEGIVNAFPGPVVNRPVPGLSGRNILARRGGVDCLLRCGFVAPDAYLGGQYDRIQSRLHALGYRQALVAGLHTPATPTIIEVSQICDRITEVSGGDSSLPFYIVGVPEGTHIQIFCVGRMVIAVDPGSGRRIETANTVYTSACELAAALGVQFCEVQAVLTPGGESVCLGVNEFPIFNHCAADVQDTLTSALADILESPKGTLI